MPSALLLPVLTCAAVLIVSGVAKLRAPETVDSAFTSLEVPKALDTAFVRRLSPWVEVALGAWLLLATGVALVVVATLTLVLFSRLPRARRARRAPPRAGRLRLLRCARRLAGDAGDGVAQRRPRALRAARGRGRAAGRGPDRRRGRRGGTAVDRHRHPDVRRRRARRLPRAHHGSLVGRAAPRRRRQLPAPADAARSGAHPGRPARAAVGSDPDVGPPAGVPQSRLRALRAASGRCSPVGTRSWPR